MLTVARKVPTVVLPVVDTSSKRKKKGKKKKNKGKNKRGGGGGSGGGDLGLSARNTTLGFIKSLVNPFSNNGVKLGWGCLVPSTLVSAVVRTSATSNADGSIAFVLSPQAPNPLYLNNSGAASTTWTTIAMSNQNGINNSCAEGRVISFGVRVFPSIPMTSAPGACYTGASLIPTLNVLTSLSPNVIAALPTSHVSIGYGGGSSTGRPADPDSYSFFSSPIVGYAGTTTLTHSLPYIVFLGLPASSVVYIEAVVNLEATTAVTSVSLLPDTAPMESDTLCAHYPSLEYFWSKISAYLPAPGRPGEATAADDDTFMSTILGSLRMGVQAAGRQVINNMISRAVSGNNGPVFTQSYPQQYSGYLR